MAKMKSYLYSFKIELVFVLPNKQKIPIKNINELTKSFNFLVNFFPIYECDCNVPIKYTTLIRSNQNSIYAIMTIIKENRIKSEKNISEIESEEEIINHIFVPFFAPDSFNNFINDEVETNESDGQKINHPGAALNARLKFALYSSSGLSFNKSLINFVAKDCDVGTALMHVLKVAEVKKCLIDEPDNKSKFAQFIVPPFNVNSALKYIQTIYGIYANGLTVFYDPPILYIMNKFSLKHEHELKKQNKIMLKCHMSSPGAQIGIAPAIEMNDDIIKYRVSSFPIPINDDVAFNELMGKEVLFSNIALTTNMIETKENKATVVGDPTKSITSDRVAHKSTGVKRVVVYDETNNPYNITSLLKASNFGTLVTIPKIYGIDCENFKPNTSIILNVDDDNERDNEFGGRYSLLAGEIKFVRNNPVDESFISSIHDLVLSRMDSK